MDRRSFIKQGTAGTAALLYPFGISGIANDKPIKIGLIGSGWYGMVITRAALKAGGVEVVAVCDVDSEHLNKSAGELEKLQGKRPETFKDYRDLLDLKALDAIMIGTVPHWHALQFIAACEKGLDIYCEKPLAYDVKEGLAMVKAAEKAGNIVQVGFQRRQSAAFNQAKSMIGEGTIGQVRQVRAQIHYNPVLQDTTIQSPPKSLDWEAWCGPAPRLPYRPSIGHMAWRLEKEYGNGHLVDWGIHHIDTIRMILGLGMPHTFEASGALDALSGKITTPDTLQAHLHFDELPVFWEHRLWGSGTLNPQFNNGIFFYGDKGTLYAADQKIVLMPAGKNREQQLMEIPTEGGMQDKHVADFIAAVKKKDKSLISCPIGDAFQSTATVQLAMVAYDTGSRVNWDHRLLSVEENPEAEKRLARPYREGYTRPSL